MEDDLNRLRHLRRAFRKDYYYQDAKKIAQTGFHLVCREVEIGKRRPKRIKES